MSAAALDHSSMPQAYRNLVSSAAYGKSIKVCEDLGYVHGPSKYDHPARGKTEDLLTHMAKFMETTRFTEVRAIAVTYLDHPEPSLRSVSSPGNRLNKPAFRSWLMEFPKIEELITRLFRLLKQVTTTNTDSIGVIVVISPVRSLYDKEASLMAAIRLHGYDDDDPFVSPSERHLVAYLVHTYAGKAPEAQPLVRKHVDERREYNCAAKLISTKQEVNVRHFEITPKLMGWLMEFGEGEGGCCTYVLPDPGNGGSWRGYYVWLGPGKGFSKRHIAETYRRA